jgi:hypothetical protein
LENDSDAQALYGIRGKVISNREIRTGSTLEIFAETQLSMMSSPKKNITIDMVDLSQISDAYRVYQINPGQWIRITTAFGNEWRT